MSSHHIVREKQEPALLILNLEEFGSENLGQLLEWSPTVLTLDSLFLTNDLKDLKTDIIITEGEHFVAPNNSRLIRSTEDKIADALNYLIADQYSAVNIIDNEFVPEDYAPFVNRINMVVYNAGKKIYPVKSGFSKWKPEGERIDIFGDSVEIITSGLVRLNNYTYFTEGDGFISINFNFDFIFIAEHL